ncbi:MAG: ThuA domain-containing protein [Bryobacterales bacterium]|nr:ThuA domain-containing protein [Bryobacterales bacterium]
MLLLLALLLAMETAAGQSTLALFRPGAIRALILSGRNNHDWRSTTPELRKILLETGRFDVRVVEEPTGLTADTLAAYQVILLDYNGPRWGAATERAVESFVRSGGGLVPVHAASYAFVGLPVLADNHVRTSIIEPPWPEYAEMIGGHFSDQPPRTGHGQRHTFRVRLLDREHPVTRGLPESFLVNDELYHNMRMRPQARVLAVAFDDARYGGTGKDEPVMWTLSYGKGRVFHTVLGHDVAAMQEPGFRWTLARGAEWAATGAVAASAPARDPSAVRALVVTGGHSYDPTFYRAFEGDERIRATIYPHPGPFQRDLRKSWDVLVLYDMVQEDHIGEEAKKNLRNFVESGRGLVVLHHALASYQGWSWWSAEVVGGKYLLRAEGDRPASTYQHDVELQVEPVAKHPVLSGVGRMHIWDETYKGMWISPKNTVLLRTDHPGSDGPVAWVSPYEKSRVVVIQLGHDRKAHLHPGWQLLVRNAILWTAGRLP